MNPTISYKLAQDRISELRREAQRDALAKAARSACRTRRPPPRHPALEVRDIVIRYVLGLLTTRRPFIRKSP